MHHGHDLGQIFRSHAQVDAYGISVAMSVAGILAIQDGRNVRGETRIENLFGICDACRNAGYNLCISQLLEGFVFRHVRILAYLGVQV